jgi:isocitrate/isopropylmalate dehydrogenase
MMLDFLGESEAAARIVKAVGEPSSLSGTTSELGDRISERV